MGNAAIIGKQQPRFICEAMVEYIRQQGHEAELLDMPTRNTADWKEALLGYDAVISAGEKTPGETIRFLGGRLKLISRLAWAQMRWITPRLCGMAWLSAMRRACSTVPLRHAPWAFSSA